MENVKRYFCGGKRLILLGIILYRTAGVLWIGGGAVPWAPYGARRSSMKKRQETQRRYEQYRKKMPPGQTKASVTFYGSDFLRK
jgi:hypothetical protein